MKEIKYCPLCAKRLIGEIKEGTKKLCCPDKSCPYVYWDNPTPVVLVLVEFEGKYVVTHNVDWPSWKYSLISGFLDTKEDPKEGAIREIKEELGLDTSHIELIEVSIYDKLNQLMISFYAKTSGELQLNEEHDSYKLLSLSELANWEFGKGSIPTINKWLLSNA